MIRYDIGSAILNILAANQMHLSAIVQMVPMQYEHIVAVLTSLETEGIIVKCPQTRVYRIAELGEPDWSL